MLTVPTPTLGYDPITPGVAPKEQPLRVKLGPVLADGVALSPPSLGSFVLISYRRTGLLAPQEVWDSGGNKWVPDGTAGPPTDQLIYTEGQPEPWQAIVVAAGSKDGAGNPKFGTQSTGFPQFWFRALFATAEASAVSGESPPVAFGSVADRNLMVMGPGDGEQPDTATQARLLLRNAGFQVIGGLVIRRDSPGAEVTLSNAAGASVVLQPDGSIELRPAPGRSVLVAADLETERITYRPGGGGAKEVLA